MTDDLTIDEDTLISELSRKRAEVASEHRQTVKEELSPKSGLLGACVNQIATEAQFEARQQFFREREERNRQEKLGKAWLMLVESRGRRYADCKLNNFEVHGTESERACQLAVRNQLVVYCRNLDEHIDLGEGLILFGPKGTGKDHSAMALSRHAILGCGRSLAWVNGMDLWGEVRDAMDNGTSERSLINKYTWPDVLYLSDPLPPTGDLGAHQQAMLFRILDARYSNKKANWVTINVQGIKELESRIGSQNADRLRDGATAMHCNWSSFRKSK